MAKSLVGHPYVGRLTKDEKTIIVDMNKSMHNANSYTTIKQIYNARSAYHFFIRSSDTEMQQLMKFLERDQYIHWHRLKDEDVVHSTYKTNRYRLMLLDFVGVTPTGMTFSAGFAYLERECVNNVVWTLEWFHIDKNVKAKCKYLIGKKNTWDYVMDAWFDDFLKKFEIVCSPWSMVESAHWALKRLLQNSLGDLCITLYKRLLGMVSSYALNQIATEFERVHYASKNPSRCGCVFRTTHGLPCACELSKYVIGTIPLETIHMFWQRLSFSDQGLSEPQVSITEEMETISKRFEELDACGKVTLKSKLQEITYHDLNSICPPPKEVNTKGAQKKPMIKHQRSTKRDTNSSVKRSASSSDLVVSRRTMPMLDQFHSCIHYSIENIVDVKDDGNCEYCAIAASLVKRSASSFDLAISRRTMPMLNQFHSCIHYSIVNIVDVKADGNCEYHAITALLGMGEDLWALVCNHLLKEHAKWSDEYINLLGGIYIFEELKRSLLVDELSMDTVDKWMNITDMGYVIASRYNVILVSLSLQQSMTFFSLRSQPPTDSFVHRIICIGHMYDNHFVQVYLRDHCPLSPLALLWSRNCHSQAKQ
ncbi:hypothetical protein GmHk_05G013113 [Glycine max]|nr:hypothetical protein GmHk_05G013113 [Glycine max]